MDLFLRKQARAVRLDVRSVPSATVNTLESVAFLGDKYKFQCEFP